MNFDQESKSKKKIFFFVLGWGRGWSGDSISCRGFHQKKNKQAFKYHNSSSSGSQDIVLTRFLLYAHQRLVVLCCALRPSICPSINFQSPLHNSDTIQDIFMKLVRNMNHHQTMCREQEPTIHLQFLLNCGPLKFLL